MIVDIGTDFKTIVDVVIALAVVVNAFFTSKVREEIARLTVDMYKNFMSKEECARMMREENQFQSRK
jgi:hypothetical protein